jgi:hypothetical protein
MSVVAVSGRETLSPMRVPKIGVPFLDALQVVHGPPGLIGRFLFHVDHNLKQKGLTLEFADFADVTRLYGKNRESWGILNPMFDPDVSDIPPDRAMCVVVRDRSGAIVATAGGKHFDAPDRSFRDIVNSGEFFGLRRVDGKLPLETEILAPAAAALRGQISYIGGIWVHPDVRGLRLPGVVCHVINACMLTLWNPDTITGFVKPEVIGTELHHRYGFEHAEPSFVITKDGQKLLETVFLWVSRDDALIHLASFLDILWPQIDAAITARR